MKINPRGFDRLSPEERAEAQKVLKAYTRILEENPLAGYTPEPKQLEFHEASARTRVFQAGNRVGKTHCGVADDLIQCLDEDWVPVHLRPYKRWQAPFRCRVFTPDLMHSSQEVIDKLRELAPRGALRGGSFDKAFEKANRVLRFNNGSFIEFMSYDQDLNKLAGVSRHRIHYDEEPPEAVRTQSLKRLLDTKGDEIFTFTPELGMSWSFTSLYERRGEPGIAVIQAGMRDTLHLDDKEIDRILAELPTEEERLIAEKGEYVHMRGTFYPEYSERDHVVERLKGLANQEEIVIAIDPGYNRTGVAWLAFDKRNAVTVFDEIFIEKIVPEEIAPLIKAKNAEWKIRYPRFVIDPSARNKATVNADQVQAAYSRCEIFAEGGQNSRESGILEVKGRLQNGTLTVARNCERTRWEFPRYARDPKAADPWTALRSSAGGNELMDCVRYGVMARAWANPVPPAQKRVYSTFDFQAPYTSEKPIANPAPPLGAF